MTNTVKDRGNYNVAVADLMEKPKTAEEAPSEASIACVYLIVFNWNGWRDTTRPSSGRRRRWLTQDAVSKKQRERVLLRTQSCAVHREASPGRAHQCTLRNRRQRAVPINEPAVEARGCCNTRGRPGPDRDRAFRGPIAMKCDILSEDKA